MAFPISPVEGDTYTENNTVWIYSAVTGQWNRSIISQVNETTYIGSDGAPGGIGGNTQVIFNDNGSLASDAGLVFNKTTDALTIAGPVIHSLGTAALPAITPSGDPNTGIYSPGADQVAISTNGTGRLFVRNTGNVELTASLLLQNTSSALNIKNAAGTSRNVLFQDSSDNLFVNCTDGPIVFRAGTGTAVERMRLDSSGGFQFKGAGTAGVTQAVSFNGSAPINSLVIDSSGRLGLGTSSPSSLLSLSGSSAYVVQNSGRALAGIDLQATAGGSGLFGGAVSFGVGGTGRAAIAAIQGTTDNDVVGLGFFGHASGTAAADAVEYMRIDGSTGNVGIGTTTVSAKLHIAGAAGGGIAGIWDTAAGGARVEYKDNGTRRGLLNWDTNSLLLAADSGNSIKFSTNAGVTQHATIDSSGRLLVGTSTNFGDAATVQSIGTNAYTFQGFRFGGDNGLISLGSANGTQASPSILTTGNLNLGGFVFRSYDNAAYRIGAQITAVAESEWASGDCPTRLVFSTTADGASSPTERLRITSDGRCLFAQAAAASSATSSAILTAGSSTLAAAGWESYVTNTATRYHAVFSISGTAVGSISTNTASTAYNTSSDYRLKENVVPLTGAVDRLNQLQVHRFNFIADPNKTVDGFIAHEAQAVVPECVTGTKDEVDADGNPVYQGIDQSKLVPLLTAALQEALAEIESLKARLTAAGI